MVFAPLKGLALCISRIGNTLLALWTPGVEAFTEWTFPYSFTVQGCQAVIVAPGCAMRDQNGGSCLASERHLYIETSALPVTVCSGSIYTVDDLLATRAREQHAW